MSRTVCVTCFATPLLIGMLSASPMLADGDLQKVQHIIIVMQEDHSFDNYFGVLPYAPLSPYRHGPCATTDHTCVDALSCTTSSGHFTCSNSNPDANGSMVVAFHSPSRCVIPDLDHLWVGSHYEINWSNPNGALQFPLNNGFVRQNDLTEQLDNGVENATEDRTLSYYDQADLPFYYGLAEHFAISDRHFSSVLGPTFPNRSYLMAATSFGHVSVNDSIPPVLGYQPINGTIFDLFDSYGITWADYFEDVPQDSSFRPYDFSHNQPLSLFYSQVAGNGTLPEVSFIDPNFGTLGTQFENDEHPPTDIQRGQAFVSEIVNAVRNGPYWESSIIFITYDEHGGFYDHAKPPTAPQNGARTPDGIFPGQCKDLSFPPFSLQPGGGAECSRNFLSTTDTTLKDAEELCPGLAANPTGPFASSCAAFDQLGVRVPLIAVSPFSKRTYVSHTVGDHDSLLALIEKRFLENGSVPLHLTRRDQYANTLEDMFDFDRSPSLNITVGKAEPPAHDCTP